MYILFNYNIYLKNYIYLKKAHLSVLHVRPPCPDTLCKSITPSTRQTQIRNKAMALNSAQGCSGLKPVILVLHQCLQSASRGCSGVGTSGSAGSVSGTTLECLACGLKLSVSSYYRPSSHTHTHTK